MSAIGLVIKNIKACCAHMFKDIEVHAGWKPTPLANDAVGFFDGPAVVGESYYIAFRPPTMVIEYITIQMRGVGILHVNGLTVVSEGIYCSMNSIFSLFSLIYTLYGILYFWFTYQWGKMESVLIREERPPLNGKDEWTNLRTQAKIDVRYSNNVGKDKNRCPICRKSVPVKISFKDTYAYLKIWNKHT